MKAKKLDSTKLVIEQAVITGLTSRYETYRKLKVELETQREKARASLHECDSFLRDRGTFYVHGKDAETLMKSMTTSFGQDGFDLFTLRESIKKIEEDQAELTKRRTAFEDCEAELRNFLATEGKGRQP